MARSKTRQRPRRPPPRRQAPQRPAAGRRRGPRLALAVAAVAGIALVIVATMGGDSDKPGSVRSQAPASAGRTGGDFHSLVADNAGRLFAGGHQAVAVSADGGRSWRPVDSLENADAMGWGFTADATFVSGHPGLNRSDDGAKTFRRVNAGLPDTDVHAFGAGTSVLYGSAPSAGVFASTDGGREWQVRSRDTGPTFFGRIVVDPSNDEHVLAADARAGVLESTDGGRTWRSLGTGPASWLSRGPLEVQTLVASGPAGTSRSDDGGRSWTPLSLPEGASIVEADPRQAGVLYAGVHSGERVRVLVSRDGGSSWARP